MPITNAGIGSFNTGRDCTIVLIGPYGTVQLDNVTGFQPQQQTNDIKSTRLDAQVLHASIPSGWTFSFDVDRGSNSLDSLFAQIESDWFTNGTLNASSLYQYNSETDGSTSTYQFTNVTLKFENAGQWQGDQATKQRVSGSASRRVRLS